jgi:hypothetical protein
VCHLLVTEALKRTAYAISLDIRAKMVGFRANIQSFRAKSVRIRAKINIYRANQVKRPIITHARARRFITLLH